MAGSFDYPGVGCVISVVVPAYNEAHRIGPVLDRIEGCDEVIVVDDGSSDDTAGVARRHGALVVKHGVNMGKGAAMVTGAKAANGNAIVFMDADGQFDPGQIPLLVSKLGSYEMVIGMRDMSAIPWNRRLTNALTRLGLLLATGRKVADPLCGFRAVRRKDFLKLSLRSRRFEVEYEMAYKALRAGLRIADVPVSVNYLGGSKLSFRYGAALVNYIVRSVFGMIQ